MLEEYFSFTITANKELASLPLVLPGHAPDITKLPLCAFFDFGFRISKSSEKNGPFR